MGAPKQEKESVEGMEEKEVEVEKLNDSRGEVLNRVKVESSSLPED